MSGATVIQPHDPGDDQECAEHFQGRQRLLKVKDANGRDQGSADPGPDGIGNADIKLLDCKCQCGKGHPIKNEHEDGRYYPGKSRG